MAESTKVKLTSKSLDQDREFDVKHAQELLAYQVQKNGISDWELAENSGYKFENGTIHKTDSKPAEKTGQRNDNK